MKRHAIILFTVMILFSTARGHAGDLTIPNSFTGGTKAYASEVNENFQAVESAVDDNYILIQDNQSVLASNGASIASIAGTIAALQSTIAALQSQVAALEAKLANVTVDDSSVINGLAPPHVILTGANLHVRNGAAQTESNNGLGNVIIGYNEGNTVDTGQRTGSHNLVIGPENLYSSYGGLVAGKFNATTGPNASVSGGSGNTASGRFSSISGGSGSASAGTYSSVSGGYVNTATGMYSSVSGGYGGQAGGDYSSVTSGYTNEAVGLYSSVTGGYGNSASASYSTVSGGAGRNAADGLDWVGGGLLQDF